MKKLLIALLGINALLIALLTAQAAQAMVKTYDVVKLAQYVNCIERLEITTVVVQQADFDRCFKFKP